MNIYTRIYEILIETSRSRRTRPTRPPRARRSPDKPHALSPEGNVLRGGKKVVAPKYSAQLRQLPAERPHGAGDSQLPMGPKGAKGPMSPLGIDPEMAAALVRKHGGLDDASHKRRTDRAAAQHLRTQDYLKHERELAQIAADRSRVRNRK